MRITEIDSLDLSTEADQLAAMRVYGYLIKDIKDPSEAVQLAAVEQSGENIQYIKNPSEKVKLASVQHSGYALRYIKDPSEEVQLAAVSHRGYGEALSYISNPSEAVQLAAVRTNGASISFIKNPSEAVKWAAIRNYSPAIQHIKNPSEAMKIAVVQQDAYLIRHIKDTTKLWANLDVKKKILRTILLLIKNGDSVLHLYLALREKACPWPELDAIERILRNDRELGEHRLSAKSDFDKLDESVISSKRRLIKPKGEIVYDGDPLQYEWKASSIKRQFDNVEKTLHVVNRRFDTLLIVKHFNERWFLATSEGAPEVVFYFYYDAHGSQTYVYIDFQRYKTQEFINLPEDEKVKLVSIRNPIDPVAIWNKERSIEHIGAAFEAMDPLDVDAAIKKIGLKLLKAVGKLQADDADINKLARFINSLIKIKTADAIKFAKECMEFFKKSMLEKLRSLLVHDLSKTLNTIARLKKKNFDWSELDTFIGGHKSEIIKEMVRQIKVGYLDSMIKSDIKLLRSLGYNWVQLDALEQSIKKS